MGNFGDNFSDNFRDSFVDIFGTYTKNRFHTAQRCVFPVSFPVDLLLWQSHKGSTGKETGKTHLCATLQIVSQHLSSVCTVEPLRFYRPEMSTKIAKTSSVDFYVMYSSN